ncbi:hypothetical protein EON64_00225 [archaeon]|nr:MAG: hypothetical protein EON64_00225 [archaeon]
MICFVYDRDVKTRQAEIEVESAAAFNVTNARRVVHSANTSGSTGSRSNLAATTATVRRVRNDEAIKKAFIFSTAKQVRDAIETYDSALLGDLANVNV